MKHIALVFIALMASASLMAQTAIAPAAGNGSAGNPYEIATLENLYWIAADNDVVPNPNRAARWSSHYIQTEDIDASDTENWFDGAGWSPIGYYAHMDISPFTGSYNGNGFVIDSLYIYRPELSFCGLFGFARLTVRLENIGLSNVNIVGYLDVGSLVGYFGTMIVPWEATVKLSETGDIGIRNDPGVYNCWSSGSISGTRRVGGLLGSFRGSEMLILPMENSFSYAVVTGDHQVGGLSGWAYFTVLQDVSSSATVQGIDNVGGIIGLSNVIQLVSSHFSGTVSGVSKVGCLIGNNTDSLVSKCYATGSATGIDRIGGVTGQNRDSSIIEASYFTGLVSGEEGVGGIAGLNSNSIVRNSFNRGIIKGTDLSGGLIGSSIGSGIILNSFSSGEVHGDGMTGGLIGIHWDTTVSNSYWDTETSGQNSSAGGEGRTTVEMTYPYADNTYVNWDFIEVWTADIDYDVNAGYPYLQGIDFPVSVEDNLIAVVEPAKLYNYPNPFNPETTIFFFLSHDVEQLSLTVYNIRGQLVRRLITNTPHPEGEYQIVWDGRDEQGYRVASGIYLYLLSRDSSQTTRKMLLLK